MRSPESCLDEAVGLAQAIDLDVVESRIVPVSRIRPATFIGGGAVDDLADRIAELEVAVVVIDTTLTPIQQRNLERVWKCKVIDRTGLILEIFGARARSREGTLQVELAHLTYQRSRLVRSWTHLERQRGGYGFLGGPGESQIEADRRQINDRIDKLKRELEAVRRRRGLHRKARRRNAAPVIALVGYTNAGKSSLFNRLSGADVYARNLLFATLDPTMRGIHLPSGRRVILSDTVGFVSDLPTSLVAAFRATLEEVREADLILHVRDIAHEDSEAQKADVLEVLDDLEIPTEGDTDIIEVLNKIDLLTGNERAMVLGRAERERETVALSAATGEGCDRLLTTLDQRLSTAREVVDLSVSLKDGAAIAWLYRHGEVLSRTDDEENARFRVGLDPADLARFSHRIATERHEAQP